MTKLRIKNKNIYSAIRTQLPSKAEALLNYYIFFGIVGLLVAARISTVAAVVYSIFCMISLYAVVRKTHKYSLSLAERISQFALANNMYYYSVQTLDNVNDSADVTADDNSSRVPSNQVAMQEIRLLLKLLGYRGNKFDRLVIPKVKTLSLLNSSLLRINKYLVHEIVSSHGPNKALHGDFNLFLYSVKPPDQSVGPLDLKVLIFEIELGKQVPHLLLDAKTNAAIWRKKSLLPVGLKMKNFDKLDLEGDFQVYYQLYVNRESKQELDILTILSPDFMDWLINLKSDFDIELSGTRLVIFKRIFTSIYTRKDVEEIFQVADKLLPRLDKALGVNN